MNERAVISEESTASGHRARLRQRLLDGGPAGFHDYELIEYLLTLTIPRVDTKPLAKKLLSEFGGIGPLLSGSADTLRREGLTDATIAALNYINHKFGSVPNQKDIIAFYKSPLGKKLLEGEPKAGEATTKRAEAWVEKYAEATMAKMRAEMRKRGHNGF